MSFATPYRSSNPTVFFCADVLSISFLYVIENLIYQSYLGKEKAARRPPLLSISISY